MSGQWEVVGKKKNKDNVALSKGLTGTGKNKTIAPPTLKVEDVLPLKQVKSLFLSNKNKENRKPAEKAKTQENGTTKKVQKKVNKQKEGHQPKQAKLVNNALDKIDAEELKHLFKYNVQSFNMPLVWLKELAQYINHQVPIEIDNTKDLAKLNNYPFLGVSVQVQDIIKSSIHQAGEANAKLFFDIALTSMANDMNKNLSVLGYKLYLQSIARSYASDIGNNCNKYNVLRNSYQNYPPIGSSILWAFGQVALSSPHHGFKVFEDIMLPLIEMKNYSRFVVQYLLSLINYHKTKYLSLKEYLLVLDVAFANYKNFPMDLRKDVQKVVSNIGQMLLTNVAIPMTHTYVDVLLKKMYSNNHEGYREELCKVISLIIIKNKLAGDKLINYYFKYIPQMAVLLKYIETNWKSFSLENNNTRFSEFLHKLEVELTFDLSLNPKAPDVLKSLASVKNLKLLLTNPKMVYNRPSYKRKSFILLIIIGVLIYRDIQHHGSWERSAIYKGLKNYGILNYTDKALQRSREGLHWLHVHIDEHFPGYYEKSAVVLQPYAQLSRDLAIIGRNHLLHLKEVIVTKYYPGLVALVDTYAPGLYEASQKAVVNIWQTTVLYSARGITYLKNEVFVGQLAPENIQRILLEAVNTTQRTASQCCNWLYERLQSIIK